MLHLIIQMMFSFSIVGAYLPDHRRANSAEKHDPDIIAANKGYKVESKRLQARRALECPDLKKTLMSPEDRSEAFVLDYLSATAVFFFSR